MIVPALEWNNEKALIEATDNFSNAGYPRDAELLLMLNLMELSQLTNYLKSWSTAKRIIAQALSLVIMKDFHSGQEEKQLFHMWSYGADYYCMDGSIPRGKLAEALLEIKLSENIIYQLQTVFTGDGNLHPLIMFDGNDKDQLIKTEEFGAEILKLVSNSVE